MIVCDNGSDDETASLATTNGAHVVSESQRGYGSACLRALTELDGLVEANDVSPQIVVFIDADYSDHPDELPELVAPIRINEADLVIGSRLLGKLEPGAMPPQSRYGNKLACFLMRIFWGAHYSDLGPFRAIRYRSLKSL